MILDAQPAIRTFTLTDPHTGEIILSKTWRGTENGKDWCILYRQTAALMASGRLTANAIRVYMFLVAYQDWKGFYSTTRADFAKSIGLSRTTLNRALNELKALDLIREQKAHGVTYFFINPDFASQGRDHNARCEQYYQLPSGGHPHTPDVLPRASLPEDEATSQANHPPHRRQ